MKYVFYANDSILVTKLHVRVPSYPKGGGKLYRRLKFSNCATKECDESNATRSGAPSGALNSCKRFRCLRPNPQRDEIKDSSRLRSKRAIFHWCPPQCVRPDAIECPTRLDRTRLRSFGSQRGAPVSTGRAAKGRVGHSIASGRTRLRLKWVRPKALRNWNATHSSYGTSIGSFNRCRRHKMYLCIPILPLASSIVAGLFGRFVGPTGASLITTSCLYLALFFSCVCFYEVGLCGAPCHISAAP